jgi:glycosyltransferase involved in cell wall biosynthesis
MKGIKLPLISVAVITYNQKKFLKECIESILEQDYENIEIVIADDASSDGTQAMLMKYQKKYPDKFVLKLSQTNQGITKNSNLAHFACSGKYIAWMGGDDLMLPGKIKKQVEYMEKHESCNILHHDLDVFYSETNETLFYAKENQKKLSGKISELIKYGTFNGACASMVRMSKTPTYGYDKRIINASDWFYWIESCGEEGEIHFIDEVLGRHRRHDNNITVTARFQNMQDHLITMTILLSKKPQYINEIRYSMATILASMRKEHDYRHFLISSLKFKFKFKVFIVLLLNIITFNKVKF